MLKGDAADIGFEVTESFLSEALSNRKPEAPKGYTGECYNCGELIEKPRRWCDQTCASEWEKNNAPATT